MKPIIPPPGSIIIRPSDAEAIAYRQAMTPMIRAMAKDILRETMLIYRPWRQEQARANRVTGDASIVSMIAGLFRRLRGKWLTHAEVHVAPKAEDFVKKADVRVEVVLRRGVEKIGADPDNLKPEPRRRLKGGDLETVRDAAIHENVSLIKSIPQEYLASVERDVLQAVTEGWPLDRLSATLQERYGVTKRRADLIARDQNAKITESIKTQRTLAAGFVESDWWHSSGSRYPRKSHMAANGRRFLTAEGCLIDGEHIQCGQKINCKCFSTPVIPGR